MTAAFLYILLIPRPLGYGFILLTPAVLYFSLNFLGGGVGRWIVALIFSAHGLFELTFVASASPFVVYAPFLLNLCLWLLVVSDAGRSRRGFEGPRFGLDERSVAMPASPGGQG